jgi:hypothetical protein
MITDCDTCPHNIEGEPCFHCPVFQKENDKPNLDWDFDEFER